jgi:TRAP transporter 4TM/12TM fusion protein
MAAVLSHAGLVRLAVIVTSVAMALYHMWVIAFGTPEAMIFRGTHLLFALVLVFLLYRLTTETDTQPVSDDQKRTSARLPTALDYVLLVAGALPLLHLFFNYQYVVNRIYYIDDLTWTDMSMAVVMVVIVLEATRRVIGWALPLTALVFLFYGLVIARLEPERLLDQLFIGIPLSVSAAYVLIFVLFGSFMERTGTGQLFMDFAMSLTGHSAGGPGKVAVVSSSLFGTISGSAVANVMVDGPISIPLMKRSGFSPHFAAGVEATASTGGQIMPPIMGAAAFVMAEFLAVSYAQVVIWAIIPAILYYVSCFAAVHFEAKRRGLVGLPRSELPRLGRVLRERGHLFIPVLTILTVMYSGYSAPLAALAGTLACFPVAALRKSTRGYVNFPNLIGAFVDGAKNALGVATACACAGIVIGIVTLSGLGIVFTQFVIGLAKDTLLLALVVTMIAGIVLGMGMPTTPAYIIMTALLVPAIIKLGVIPPAAHMFAFYFAVLSAITPPVALAVYAAAGLAKSDLWASGWAAVKIGAAGFIVPFMLVYEPALMMIGEWPHVVGAFCTASAGS